MKDSKLYSIIIIIPKIRKLIKTSSYQRFPESSLLRPENYRISPVVLRKIEENHLFNLIKPRVKKIGKLIQSVCSEKWRKWKREIILWVVSVLKRLWKQIWGDLFKSCKPVGVWFIIGLICIISYWILKSCWDFLMKKVSEFSILQDLRRGIPRDFYFQTQLQRDLFESPNKFYTDLLMWAKIGRVALLNYEEGYGKLVVIVDVINQDTALIDAPDMARGKTSFRRLSLTDIKIDVGRMPEKNVLINAMEVAEVKNKWENSFQGKEFIAKKKRALSKDFERFKVMCAKIERCEAVRRELPPVQQQATRFNPAVRLLKLKHQVT